MHHQIVPIPCKPYRSQGRRNEDDDSASHSSFTREDAAMSLPDLMQLGLWLVFTITAIALATLAGVRMKEDTRRSGQRERP